MSLISKDFRLQEQRNEQHGHARLRWALFAIACAGIGAVIASTNTEERSDTTEIATSALPELAAVNKSPEELARESFTLTLPELQARQRIDNEDNASNPILSPKKWREFTIKSGDSLALLLKRAEIKPQQLDELMKSGDAVKKLRRILPNKTIRVLSDSDGILQALRYDIDKKSYLSVEREQGVLVAKIYNHKFEARQTHASAVIDSSLFLAGKKAGISDNVIMELANIFGWDIDFSLDIRKGDNFTVLYEELFRDGEKVSDGKILAADFVNNGKIYRAIRYTDPQTNKSEYYTPDGKSMRKAFIRSPVHFSRISSGFNLKRRHPILLNKRPHKGVDYAAKSGTPIYAAGDGKVIFKGKKGGYGKVMILKHGTKYTTLYAHLKTYNRKLRNGSRVKQGQTIAYVGSTGLATGPHLHYEFRVNGVHRNPLTVSLPVSNPVPKKQMANFDKVTSPIVAQLDSLTRPQRFALTEN